MGFWRQNDGYKNVRKIIPLYKSYGRQKDEPLFKNGNELTMEESR